MTYQNIQPPFTLQFREMSEKELKDYNEWFLSSVAERIEKLTTAVKSSEGFEDWEPDYSPKSLEALGEWFTKQVETRQLSEQEIQDILDKQTPFKVGTENWTLTIRTRSLVFDIGMYLSQVFLNNHPTLRWDQQFTKFRGKKFIDYGQPVLAGFGTLSFNPVRMLFSLANGIAWTSKTGSGLRELYDIWSSKVTPASGT